ncbi:MAG: 3'-5' exonuclease [Clostridia bacterium]|nr:3'-5' exonuclease [Clostridia bacterium]
MLIENKGNNDNACLAGEKYVAAVIETTGDDPASDGIVMLSAVRVVRGRITGKFKSLVDPGIKLTPPVAGRIGFTDEMLVSAPPTDDMLEAFVSFIGGDTIVGADIDEKLAFINAKCTGGPIKNAAVDLSKLNRALFPELEDHSFSELAASLLGGTRSEHAASASIPETVAKCYEALKRYCEDNGILLEKAPAAAAKNEAAALVQSIRAAEQEQVKAAANESKTEDASTKEPELVSEIPAPAETEKRSKGFRAYTEMILMLVIAAVVFCLLIVIKDKLIGAIIAVLAFAVLVVLYLKYIRRE